MKPLQNILSASIFCLVIIVGYTACDQSQEIEEYLEEVNPKYNSDNLVLIGNEAGKFFVVGGESGEILREWQLDGAVRSTPVYVPGIDSQGRERGYVAVATMAGTIYFLDPIGGQEVSTEPLRIGEEIVSSLLLLSQYQYDRIYFGTTSGKFYCYEIQSVQSDKILAFEEKWSIASSSGAGFTSSPTFNATQSNGTRVITGCDDGFIYAFDGSTGESVWNYYTEGAVQSSPVVDKAYNSDDDYVYVGNDIGNIICLEAMTGGLRWSQNISASALTSSFGIPRVGLRIGTNEGKLYTVNYPYEKNPPDLSFINYGSPIKSTPIWGFFGTLDGRVIDAPIEGTTKADSSWVFPTTAAISSSACRDFYYNFFIGDENGQFYCFVRQGDLLNPGGLNLAWKTDTRAAIKSSPVILGVVNRSSGPAITSVYYPAISGMQASP